MQKSESFRVYPVTVTAAGTIEGTSVELDPNYEKLTGIYLIDKSLTNYPTMDFSHDGKTNLIASGFPVEFLIASKDISPDQRFKDLDLIAQKKELKINIKDPGGNAYPYTLNFVYRLENKIK